MEITENKLQKIKNLKILVKQGKTENGKSVNCRILSMQNVWKYWDIRLLRMLISVQKS